MLGQNPEQHLAAVQDLSSYSQQLRRDRAAGMDGEAPRPPGPPPPESDATHLVSHRAFHQQQPQQHSQNHTQAITAGSPQQQPRDLAQLQRLHAAQEQQQAQQMHQLQQHAADSRALRDREEQQALLPPLPSHPDGSPFPGALAAGGAAAAACILPPQDVQPQPQPWAPPPAPGAHRDQVGARAASCVE